MPTDATNTNTAAPTPPAAMAPAPIRPSTIVSIATVAAMGTSIAARGTDKRNSRAARFRRRVTGDGLFDGMDSAAQETCPIVARCAIAVLLTRVRRGFGQAIAVKRDARSRDG